MVIPSLAMIMQCSCGDFKASLLFSQENGVQIQPGR